MIRYILLGFLQYQPMTGYEIKQTIDRSTAHFWHAYHSQIYTTLRQMDNEGLITSQFFPGEGQPDRRIYSLTPSGLKVLNDWLEQPLTDMSPVKEELLVRIFFSARREKKKVLAELLLQRELHQRKLAAYHAITNDPGHPDHEKFHQFQRDAVFWAATLKMGIRYEETYLAWLDETIQTIQDLESKTA